MQTHLSAPEQKVFEALKKTKHDSLWNVAINKVVQSCDAGKLRELINQLQMQDKDNPPVMKIILGDAYDTVINFKTAAGDTKSN